MVCSATENAILATAGRAAHILALLQAELRASLLKEMMMMMV
jgi:hypothetical protein